MDSMSAMTAPLVGVDLIAPQPQIVYALASGSNLANSIRLVISNPTNQDIPWAAGARIEIVLYTTETGDPRSMTTPAAAKNVHPDVSGCKRAWSLKPSQGSDSYVLALYPDESSEPLLRHGDQSQLMVSLSNLRSDLPLTEDPIPFLVRAIGFPGLSDNRAPFSFIRQWCPRPTGDLWAATQTPFEQAQLASWSLDWADALTVAFSDGFSADSVFSFDASDASKSDFSLRAKTFLPGTVSIEATNDSNPGSALFLSAPTRVSGAFCRVRKSLLVSIDDNGAIDGNAGWSFDYPSGFPANIPAPDTSVEVVASPFPGGPGRRHTTTASINFFRDFISPSSIVARADRMANFEGSGQTMWAFSISWPDAPAATYMCWNIDLCLGPLFSANGNSEHGPWSLSVSLCEGFFLEAALDLWIADSSPD
jgi:hypothetical protein